MNIWKSSRPGLVALAMLVAMAPSAAPAADEGKSAAPAADEGKDDVLAIVNGEEINRTDVMMARNRLPAQLRELPEEQILPVLINVVIDSRLLADQARKENIAEEPEVKAQMQIVQDMVLEQSLLTRHLQDKITEEALRERYEAMIKDEDARKQVHAQHILVKERSEAEEVIRKLNDGADFNELVKEKSASASPEAGGDLGYFSRGDMIPAFSEVAFSLEPGTYSRTPVQTEFGWHVIKVEDRRVVDPPPFEEVRNQLQQQLAMELRTEYVKQLREQAEITRLYQPPLTEEAPQGTSPSPNKTPQEGAAPKGTPPR